MRPLCLPLVIAVLLGSCSSPKATQPVPPSAPSLPATGSSGSQAGAANGTAATQTAQEQGRSRGLEQGHTATVDCLHGERAQTDGSELRCEDWSYVRQNYLQAR